MGVLNKLLSFFGSKKQAQILVVGLDNSGKSTLINYIKSGAKFTKTTSKHANSANNNEEVVPTIGFQVEEFQREGIKFTVFDMSGQSTYRDLWEKYYREVQAIIFVIDSTDKARMCVAKEELEGLLSHEELKAAIPPVLFFANKMDLPNGFSPAEILENMELQKINQSWHIKGSNAKTGEGVDEGIEWLATTLKRLQKV